jgi:5-formyltetrahydrofolate cyclo-ligase
VTTSTTPDVAGEDPQVRHRERIWNALLAVARPDSRFHWDFSSFIADFEGSDRCAEAVRTLDAYRSSERIFITPDNSTEMLRRVAMADGKPFAMTTYGIRRGFLVLDPADVPAAERSYAATLDGMDRYARPVTMAELARWGHLGLLVTGGSAVSTNGVRFGKGHGYFDLEWALLCEFGCTDATTQIVDVVHDCQVVGESLAGADHDVPVDWIVTPTRAIRVDDVDRKAGRVRWEMLAGTDLESVPPIMELRALRGTGA